MNKLRPDLFEAPSYVVTCLERDMTAGDRHDHVLAVETRDPDGGETRWSTVEVIAAVRGGEHFVVAVEGRDERISIEPAICTRCATVTLSVSPGGTEIAPCA